MSHPIMNKMLQLKTEHDQIIQWYVPGGEARKSEIAGQRITSRIIEEYLKVGH